MNRRWIFAAALFGGGWLMPGTLAGAEEKGKQGPASPVARGGERAAAIDPALIHPTVRYPVPDGIDLTVPPQLGNQELARLGYVDATAAPFFADPSGQSDATRALQAAIDFARDHQMVCFLPLGTYRVSDTLHCLQNYYRRANGVERRVNVGVGAN